ncbi:SDR family oxidoreductase [Umezakia ovalisporum]|jgi:serine 3-dehydrogenase|uniref:SDR family oxidoreductase n=1 Tax=Umezakia ovalisporum TaxID=75695 RepID=UPI0006EF9D63|nr:SDR family oxidoreductase [Umezakia ovalisporum]MBI1242108.1 SDR family NAD(P)-dependent oxidoreductase [Nostoc sp. RI_552]MDH6068675.1 SDR family oxidoreductase [Umezakia ovalisporum APH033B]MDH6083465.1 SDR family oxidoreductase [Umezakia ovalisporum TAC611]MDH6087490.1 SDR family oxidoreductase [Umezakia ovalisporum Ak1311]CEJ47927.1 Short chain dehydrogenase (Short-chain dehydrogen ase/reductase SDR) [Umezakia ovalisporum]
MISLQNQIILITGASSGIGAACARIFAGAGAKLILAARRWERLQELANNLKEEFGVEIYLLHLDVRDRSAVEYAIANLPPGWSDIDILINNAGLSRGLDKLYEGDIQGWEEMIDTNINGLLYLSRYVVPGMVKRDRGHIVNLGSIAGHQTYPGGNVYCATKAAVRAISEGLKQDLLGTRVRVTSIDPGMVETEFSNVRFYGDHKRSDKVYQGLTPLTGDDVADVIFFCVTRSPHVNINELILMPVDQASATLVHRQS